METSGNGVRIILEPIHPIALKIQQGLLSLLIRVRAKIALFAAVVSLSFVIFVVQLIDEIGNRKLDAATWASGLWASSRIIIDTKNSCFRFDLF